MTDNAIRDIPDRIYNQYRDKPKAAAWLNVLNESAIELADDLELVRKTYDVDNAETDQLNIIGRIVVVSRAFVADIKMPQIMCSTSDEFLCGDLQLQCSAQNISSDDVLANDYYRRLIKAKIIKNSSNAQQEDIAKALLFVAPSAGDVYVIDHQDMTYSIEFYGLIDPINRYLLEHTQILPKPQAVRFRGFYEGYNAIVCSDDNSLLCGDTAAECTGFIQI